MGIFKDIDALGDKFKEYMDEGKYKEGTGVYKQLVAMVGKDYPKIAQVLDSMFKDANTLYCKSLYEQAKKRCEGAIPIYEQRFGSNDPKTVKFRSILDDCRKVLDRRKMEYSYSSYSSYSSYRISSEPEWRLGPGGSYLVYTNENGEEEWVKQTYDSGPDDYIHSDDEGDGGGDGGDE